MRLPDNWQEKDLQQAIASRLRQHGFDARLEVKFNGGYADIVTNWLGGTIIEIKKYLDRNTIYQAVGQLKLYGEGSEYKLVATGFIHPKEQSKTRAIASMVEQTGVKVLFLGS